MNLIVRKTGTIFDFCESSDGVEYDGIIYGGSSVKLSYTNDTLKVIVDGGESKEYALSQLNYDDGNEIIGFATMLEFIDAVKTAGFTGNFNSAGASAQIKTALYYFEGQDETGFLGLVEKFNNTGVEFTFTRDVVGVFLCPEFDSTKHTIYSSNPTVFSGVAQYVGGSIRTGAGGNLDDYTFEFGGWIKIEQIN